MTNRPALSDQEKTRARQLRRNATFPERLLWGRLRAGRMNGVKFRRQHPINEFVLDFYCDEARLAIELDGDSHAGRAEYDNDRSRQLAKLGIRVLRIANDDVLRDLDAVLELILLHCEVKS